MLSSEKRWFWCDIGIISSCTWVYTSLNTKWHLCMSRSFLHIQSCTLLTFVNFSCNNENLALNATEITFHVLVLRDPDSQYNTSGSIWIIHVWFFVFASSTLERIVKNYSSFLAHSWVQVSLLSNCTLQYCAWHHDGTKTGIFWPGIITETAIQPTWCSTQYTSRN